MQFNIPIILACLTAIAAAKPLPDAPTAINIEAGNPVDGRVEQIPKELTDGKQKRVPPKKDFFNIYVKKTYDEKETRAPKEDFFDIYVKKTYDDKEKRVPGEGSV